MEGSSINLGNTRITLDGGNTVYGEHHYYPFGLEMPGPWKGANPVENDYLYNGKELNKDFSLNLYDYGARMYDVAIGRFTGVDPLAEKMSSWSPYNYTFDNPLIYTDPTGMSPDDIILRGSNNSSVTIKTDIIDVELDVSGIVGDLGGNHTLEGDDIIDAALDIGGIVDQTGMVDGAAAIYHGKKGNVGSATISGLSVFPGGDLLKIAKAGKHTKTIKNAISDAKQAFRNAEPGSPALKGNPYSPGEVSKRQSQTRRDMGLNPDPKTTIPDQPPGRNLKQGVHTSTGKNRHSTGERNVSSKEEHSRVTKGNRGIKRN